MQLKDFAKLKSTPQILMQCDKVGTILGLGLISGGLDSLIATLILKLQNIDIVTLNFRSPFCLCDKALRNSECGLNLYYEKLGIRTYFLNKDDDYLEIVKNPKFGYGKNLNPCIDCRIYILKKAKEFAEKIKADFIFTGEVLNQRPKSQNKKALEIVEKESGLKGKLLRPLSALVLKPTILEKEEIIDRNKLLGITGRSRKIQLEIARKYGLLNEYYACGGCLLTDAAFSRRLKDYFKFNKNLTMKDMNILKFGRHFRYKNSKIIIGRNEFENKMLFQLKNSEDLIMETSGVMGPITIIQGVIDEEVLRFAAQATLRYSDLKNSFGTVLYGKKSHSKTCKLVTRKVKHEILKNHIL
ncbi:MAG: tRNA 4-thiouridine(8) synthase ThiI [Candidatus Hodarchaeota archaeon]